MVAMDRLLGLSFWSTVVRVLIAGLALNVLPLPLLLVTSVELEPGNDWAVLFGSVPMSFLFCFWVGWGLAFGRFEKRPVPDRSFVTVAALSGLPMGPFMVWFVHTVPVGDPVGMREYIGSGLFGLIVGPIVAVLTSAFWRHSFSLCVKNPVIHSKGFRWFMSLWRR